MLFRMVYKSRQIFLPFCRNLRVWQTDRQTDRILIVRPRLHSMQRGNNCRATSWNALPWNWSRLAPTSARNSRHTFSVSSS